MPTRVLDPEAIVQRTEEGVKATYRQLPEKELLEEDGTAVPKTVKMVQENGETHRDEAEEKMLSPNEGPEVKFISGDRTNGDAKVDVECLQQVFTGMGKDELMKYAKDPFWVRLRWTLFVLFWLLWTAMLVGAIVIVVAAPKCAAPVPKTWWEEGPLVNVDLPDTSEHQESLLKNLKDVGINSIVVHVPDNYDLYKDNYTYSDIKEFVEKAKALDLKVILDVQANFVPLENKMFIASEKRDPQFEDYFIWTDAKSSEEPNNWKALVNGSAWNLSSERKQYYLSQFGKEHPDLNFANTNVQNMFAESLENLMKTGISGIKMRYAKYLLVDQTFKDEAFSTIPGFVHTNYGFYTHMRTSNQAGLGELIKPWKEIVLNNTEEGVFYIAEDLDRNTFMIDDTLIPQLPGMSKKLQVLNKNTQELKAKDLYTALKSLYTESASTWPHLQYNSLNSEERSEHNMLVMLLPGVPELSPQQLLGLNMSLSEQTKILITARQNPSVKFGAFDVHLLANETVIGYSRLKPGNPGLIVLYNTEDVSTTVDLKPFLGDKVETVTVLLLSQNYEEDAIAIKSTLPASAVPVSNKSAILLSYIPASAN